MEIQWESGAVISVKNESGEIVIQANQAGLQSLANLMHELAGPDVSVHSHIHLDEYNALEEGSQPVIIEKI